MNEQHPISGIMGITMDKLKEMVDVNTIIGDPIKIDEKTTVIPISKVSFGFASVSYTHLDVYKRQEQFIISISVSKFRSSAGERVKIIAIYAVYSSFSAFTQKSSPLGC